MEGTAKWLATGPEPLGGVTAGRSIRLSSAHKVRYPPIDELA
jgi:hypothetical protein